MIDCARLDDLQRDALGGLLSPADQAAVDEHLTSCPPCLARVTNLVVQRDALRRLGELEGHGAGTPPPLSEPLVTRLVAAMVRARDERPAHRRDGTLG